MRGNVLNGEVGMSGDELDGKVRKGFYYLPFATFIRKGFNLLNAQVGERVDHLNVEVGEIVNDFNATIEGYLLAFAVLDFNPTDHYQGYKCGY